jgi:hypothetical protein
MGSAMMRPSNDLPEVYLRINCLGFCKGINELAALLESELELDLFSEKLLVFTNRYCDKVKIFY